MAALIVILGNGVTDALNAGSFSQDFTAVWQYAPSYVLPDADDLQVIVTDAGGEIDLDARRFVKYGDTIRVVLLWRVSKDSETGIDDTKMDDALLLLQEIGEYLVLKKIGDYSQTGLVTRGDGDKDKSHYFPGNLDQGSVFASDLRLEYVVHVKVEQ